MKKNITFSDIAAYTNFSKTTISRYFNSPETLTNESITKIEKALKELNYTENKVARSLANGKTEMIGVIIPNLFMHYYSEVITNLINSYNKFNYKFIVFLGSNDSEEELQYIKELMSYKIEGLIILSHTVDSKKLKELNIPIVAIEREDNYISSVNSDNYSGSVDAVKKLIDDKCEILIHINTDLKESIPSYKRIQAFKDTCKLYNKKHHVYLSILGKDYNEIYESIYKTYLDIEEKYPKIKKGIFMSNDTHANIFLNILIRNKKNIPLEYEIIGFDNSPISTEAIIPISTVSQDIEMISAEALKLLLRQINFKKQQLPIQEEHKMLPTHLILRETTL